MSSSTMQFLCRQCSVYKDLVYFQILAFTPPRAAKARTVCRATCETIMPIRPGPKHKPVRLPRPFMRFPKWTAPRRH